LKAKLILPSLIEAESPFWRPIKYSLFPPLGLATLAAFLSPDDEVDIQDQHVEELVLDDRPDLVIIQVYITNAYRAYKIADHYRAKGVYVLLGIMINGSFIFGLDDDDRDVFKRTVDWGVKNAITTATYHILTPYPGTQLYKEMEQQGRILTKNWNLYDTRHVVFLTKNLLAEELKNGYDQAYKEFYSWANILNSSLSHESYKHKLKHLFYTGGWKKFEPVWNFIIKSGKLNNMLPMLESILSKVRYN
jgi:radical SAM superfamily enzyme YgiQ (UPF0313 family)